MGTCARVMVVDDSEQLRSALETLIGANDAFEIVATARDGEEAVALAKLHRPDLILMDIRMPVMDGVEATRRILAGMSGVSVVAHTAYDDAELVADMVKAGARGYLVKGVTADELFDGLSSALAGEARISDSATRGLFEEVSRGDRTEVVGDTEVLAAMMSGRLSADALTGALQRSVFQFELEKAVAGATATRAPVSVAVLRVTDLPETNERFGWEAGDALLRGIAALVVATVGTHGVVGRIGGDELAVILSGFDAGATRRTLDELRDRCGAATVLQGLHVRAAYGYSAVEGARAGLADADLLLGAARGAARATRAGEIQMAGQVGLCDPGAVAVLHAIISTFGGDDVLRRARLAGAISARICERAGRPEQTAAAFSAAIFRSFLSDGLAGANSGAPPVEAGRGSALLRRVAGDRAADLFDELEDLGPPRRSPGVAARAVEIATELAAKLDGMSSEEALDDIASGADSGAGSEASEGDEDLIEWLRQVVTSDLPD